MADSSGSICLIANSTAAADPVLNDAINELRSQGHRIEIRPVGKAGDAVHIAAQACRAGFGTLLAAGGDGTLNEVLNGVSPGGESPSCAVGVLPYGTANDFAVAAGIPLDDPRAALRLAVEGRPVPIDLGRVNGRLFINVASGGACAEITTETSAETKQMLGGFAYFLTGLATVASLCPREVSLRAPGFEWDGPALALTVANGRQAGGGFCVAPAALVDDGLLEVMVVPDTPWDEFLSLIRDFMRLEEPIQLERVVRVRVPWLEVRAAGGLQVNADGEPMQSDHFRFDVLERRLRFCLPLASSLLAGTPAAIRTA